MEEQQIEKMTVKQVSIKWGSILGLMMIVYGMILQFAGLAGNQSLSYINYLLLAGVVYMAQKAFKEEGDGFMSYGQGLGIGSLITFVGGFISVAFSYIYVKFVDDSVLEILTDVQYEKMAEQGLSEEQIEKAMELTSAFMIPEIMFPLAFVFLMFFGFIISLIVSAITKNTDPSMEI